MRLILAVDDDPGILDLVRETLSPPARVVSATSGDEALHLLKSIRPDLILLDVNMPQMSGIEVAEKLRSESRMDKIPIIFITSDDARETVQKAVQMGAAGYVLKPFDVAILRDRVNKQLKLDSPE